MTTSNTFWIILLIVGIGLLAFFYYSNRNADGLGLVFLLIMLIPLSAPFAIAFTVLATRFLSNCFIGMIYGGNTPAEKEKYGRARLLVVEEKLEQAIVEYRRILEENPKDDYSQQQIAEIYAEKLKDYRSAVEEYTKLLEMTISESRMVSTYNRLADLYCDHLDDKQTGAEFLRIILNRYPDSMHSARAIERMKRLGF